MSLPEPPAVPVDSPYVVPPDGRFSVAEAPTKPGPGYDKDTCKARLKELRDELYDLQRILYAHDHHSVLLVFQAMDAAGKDSTIRHVLRGVNPAGVKVVSFKKPSAEELDHDFLWRTAKRLPERGRIGVFNRSYYEEVLVVRVHPGLLEGQKLPRLRRASIWEERLHSIREHEAHLARNGTVILKFWLNVSREEQKANRVGVGDQLSVNRTGTEDVGGVEETRWKVELKRIPLDLGLNFVYDIETSGYPLAIETARIKTYTSRGDTTYDFTLEVVTFVLEGGT